MTDEEAISGMNIGVPYAIICEQEDVEIFILEANKEGYENAGKIGNVVNRENEKIAGIIKGVGINNSEIIIMDKVV